MSETLKSSEVIESMIKYIRDNLQLQDRTEEESNQHLTFTGRGITEKDHDIRFALDVIINIKNNDDDRAAHINLLQRKVDERTGTKEKTYTTIILPQSIDYPKAKIKFHCPYFGQASLLETISDEIGLFDMYNKFNFNNVKDLSRFEWSFAIPLTPHHIAYYNPVTNEIQIHTFQGFPCNEVIPDNRPLNQRYFWDYMRDKKFPGDFSRKAGIFRGIQEGLHDRVRKVLETKVICSEFTLSKVNGRAANIVTYQQVN